MVPYSYGPWQFYKLDYNIPYLSFYIMNKNIYNNNCVFYFQEIEP